MYHILSTFVQRTMHKRDAKNALAACDVEFEALSFAVS